MPAGVSWRLIRWCPLSLAAAVSSPPDAGRFVATSPSQRCSVMCDETAARLVHDPSSQFVAPVLLMTRSRSAGSPTRCGVRAA